MPGLSGVDLAITFRTSRPQTRVILFSGQAHHSDILDQAEAKGHRFEVIAKPIHPRKLIELLKKTE
jgi:CheY-like chemotaxis protein